MPVPAWSYSSMKTFETCPKQYYHLRVAKDYRGAETPEAAYGTEFHKACEDYVRDGTPLDLRFAHVKPVLDALLKLKGERFCELKMALNTSLQPCDFFAKDVFVRGVADLLILNRKRGTGFYVDYKTGKSSRYADTDQLELMALMVFILFPEIRKLHGSLLFVAAGEVIEKVCLRSDRKKLWARWLGKYDRLETAYREKVWNPRPSGLCRRHCPVTECPHHGG